MAYPENRLQRFRRTPALRRLVRETRVSRDDLVYPMFVAERREDAGPIPSMPGIERYALENIGHHAAAAHERGVSAILLFGIPANKDDNGTSAYDPDGVIPRAIQRVRVACPETVIMADVCLCQYTAHGHCGILREDAIDNDATCQRLAQTAETYARAGADIVAPSAMMDGQVAMIRERLDDSGHAHIAILAYAAKFASSYYGPFREAAECSPQFGDRRTYQMDPANALEALAEIELDLEEGADALMVKPAGPYLDIVSGVKEAYPDTPLAAYQVSGEYAMIKAAAARGWLDEEAVMLESLLGIKRAGADMIITYFAHRVAELL